jgi:endonuclease YncB( thermonuclease family)
VPTLTGLAKVIDGDTIIVAHQLVRLHDIDAPRGVGSRPRA